MPMLAVVMFVVAILGSMVSNDSSNAARKTEANYSSGIAQQMIILKNVASTYASSHPQLNESVSASAVGLDGNVVLEPCLNAYVAAGKAYVYCSTSPSGLLNDLMAQTDHSFFVGVSDSGQLRNSSSGKTGLSLPSVIPSGAVVYAD